MRPDNRVSPQYIDGGYVPPHRPDSFAISDTEIDRVILRESTYASSKNLTSPVVRRSAAQKLQVEQEEQRLEHMGQAMQSASKELIERMKRKERDVAAMREQL